MQDVMVPCKKCGNKAPASSMRLDLDERLMICQDCTKNKKIHEEVKDKVFHKKAALNAGEGENWETPRKVAHKCNSCGYKFMINPETRRPGNCPYCNARVLSF